MFLWPSNEVYDEFKAGSKNERTKGLGEVLKLHIWEIMSFFKKNFKNILPSAARRRTRMPPATAAERPILKMLINGLLDKIVV